MTRPTVAGRRIHDRSSVRRGPDRRPAQRYLRSVVGWWRRYSCRQRTRERRGAAGTDGGPEHDAPDIAAGADERWRTSGIGWHAGRARRAAFGARRCACRAWRWRCDVSAGPADPGRGPARLRPAERRGEGRRRRAEAGRTGRRAGPGQDGRRISRRTASPSPQRMPGQLRHRAPRNAGAHPFTWSSTSIPSDCTTR